VRLGSRLCWFIVLTASAVAGICASPSMVVAWLAILGVIFSAAALVTIWWIAGLLRRRWHRRWLLKNGTPTRGRVIEAQFWGSPVIGIDDEGPSRLVIEIASDGARHRLELRQTMDADMMPEVGDEVMILYDPRHPSRARLAPSFQCRRP
jgi:hypothetical protein